MTEREPVSDSELAGLFQTSLSFPLALAVSGGADSMALMLLVHRWSGLRDLPAHVRDGRDSVVVLTVDHRLREGSAEDAAFVCASAERFGFRSATLTWDGEKPATAIQDTARSARYRLIQQHLEREALNTPGAAPGVLRPLVTAHHRDDQVETVFMRLARGSGIDGLGGMRQQSQTFGLDVRRPLLGVPRSRLLATLEAAAVPWVHDPSNDNPAFERVRWRRALLALEPLGLSAEHLATSAARLSRAREALDWATSCLARDAGLDIHAGSYASYDADRANVAPDELSIRLLGRLLSHFGGQPEPASLAAVEVLDRRLHSAEFETCTLAGCIVVRKGPRVEVFREPGREELPIVTIEPGRTVTWDRRFRVRADGAAGTSRLLTVGPLGAEGWKEVIGTMGRQQAVPFRAAVTVPALRWQEKIVAVPTLGLFQHPLTSDDVSTEFIWPFECDQASWLGS